ncbi:MAG: hypothetical protein Tsb0010_11820 [Parvularculaceae bacterium]
MNIISRMFVAISTISILIVGGIQVSLMTRYVSYDAPSETFGNCDEYDQFVRRTTGVDLEAASGGSLADLAEAAKFQSDHRPIIVRYSDGGELVNRCDYTKALYAVQHDPGKPKLILVFVHGWRVDSGPAYYFPSSWRAKEKIFGVLPNPFFVDPAANIDRLLYNFSDAARDDARFSEARGGDLRQFSAFVEELRERIRRNGDDRVVVPIVISWTGGAGIAPLDVLTFIDRRNTSDSIARSGHIPRMFGAIENISRIGENPDDQIVYIGHSFGARILYSSVVHRMISAVQRRFPQGGAPSYDIVDSAQDLVVLISPALEAAAYKAVDEFQLGDPFHPQQPPLILSVQAQSDWANRRAFYIGQQLMGFHFDNNQNESFGFKKSFQSHRLTAPDSGCRTGEIASNDHWYDDFCYDGVSLQHLSDDDWPCWKLATSDKCAHSPFIVAHADETVLQSHSWLEQPSDAFNKWLIGFMDRNACSDPSRPLETRRSITGVSCLEIAVAQSAP